MIKLDRKIEIRKFQDIGLLIDRPDFLRRVKKIRKELLRRELSKYEQYHYPKDIHELRSIYKYPSGFLNAIASAVLENAVVNESLKDCYGRIINLPLSFREINIEPEFEIIVILNKQMPHKKYFKPILKEISSNIFLSKSEKFEFYKNKHPILSLDLFPNIKDVREWYWMKLTKPKETYDELLEKWQQKCSQGGEHPEEKITRKICKYCGLVDKNVIEQAVSRYRKLLKTDI